MKQQTKRQYNLPMNQPSNDSAPLVSQTQRVPTDTAKNYCIKPSVCLFAGVLFFVLSLLAGATKRHTKRQTLCQPVKQSNKPTSETNNQPHDQASAPHSSCCASSHSTKAAIPEWKEMLGCLVGCLVACRMRGLLVDDVLGWLAVVICCHLNLRKR